MTDTMKIFLYEVDGRESIVDVIEHIGDLDMKDRIRTVSGHTMKLEYVYPQNLDGSEVFFLDFCKHRGSGPGRAKNDERIKGFNLKSDEAFGEMTAVLYDPETHFMVVQYNHYGPRPGSIARYFSQFRDAQVIFNPRLKDDVLNAINEKQYNKSIVFAYSGALTPANKTSLGLGAALDVIQNLGKNVGEVQICVKQKRGRFNRMTNQVDFLKKLFFIAESNDAVIKSAKVCGAMTPDDETELLDMINAKISDERGGLVKDDETKMYSFQSRCKLLRDAFVNWKEHDIITVNELR